MERLNGDRMKLMLIVTMATFIFGGERVKADFTFGEPTNLGPPVSTSYGEGVTYITVDGLEMYFDYLNRPGGYGGWDIWVSTRETIDNIWGAPVNLGPPVNTGRHDCCLIISSDGLELYFSSYNRSGGYGNYDIWLSRRATKNDPWTQSENLGPTVNTSAYDCSPRISDDGLELYFSSNRAGGYGAEDIWITKRATKNDPWGEPVNLGPVVNSSASEDFPHLSSDGLLLLFSEEWNSPIRPGGFGRMDMWMARRANVNEPWGEPVNLGPMVNTSSLDCGPIISPDGSKLYFCSERPGGFGGTYGDIYQALIIPIVDFNGDRIVDAGDMCIMVDHWGTDYPLCDIGPMPWGDGVVDVEDLIVLAEHLFEKLPGRPINP